MKKAIEILQKSEEQWDYQIPQAGDILRVDRGLFFHYGIYMGDHTVVSFGEGILTELEHAESVRVVRVPMDRFLQRRLPEVRVCSRAEKKIRRSPEDILSSAEDAVGNGGYSITSNNCEHFVNQCVFGCAYSRGARQMEEILKGFRRENDNKRKG